LFRLLCDGANTPDAPMVATSQLSLLTEAGAFTTSSFSLVARYAVGASDPDHVPLKTNRTGSPASDICERARITVFSWHDLRHAYGSEVFDRTGNIAVVQAALGHASPASVKHYLHPRVDILHEVNVAIR
jgi:integrase